MITDTLRGIDISPFIQQIADQIFVAIESSEQKSS